MLAQLTRYQAMKEPSRKERRALKKIYRSELVKRSVLLRITSLADCRARVGGLAAPSSSPSRPDSALIHAWRCLPHRQVVPGCHVPVRHMQGLLRHH